jgi:hypothetical protein
MAAYGPKNQGEYRRLLIRDALLSTAGMVMLQMAAEGQAIGVPLLIENLFFFCSLISCRCGSKIQILKWWFEI